MHIVPNEYTIYVRKKINGTICTAPDAHFGGHRKQKDTYKKTKAIMRKSEICMWEINSKIVTPGKGTSDNVNYGCFG